MKNIVSIPCCINDDYKNLSDVTCETCTYNFVKFRYGFGCSDNYQCGNCKTEIEQTILYEITKRDVQFWVLYTSRSSQLPPDCWRWTTIFAPWFWVLSAFLDFLVTSTACLLHLIGKSYPQFLIALGIFVYILNLVNSCAFWMKQTIPFMPCTILRDF